MSHLSQGIDSHPRAEQQQLDVAEPARRAMNGQPFRLRLLQAFAPRRQDPEAQLPHLLQQGVPAGILQEIPTSHQWQASLDDNGLDGVLHGAAGIICGWALQGYSAVGHCSFYAVSTFPEPGTCKSISAARCIISSISAFMSGPFSLSFPAHFRFRFHFWLPFRLHFRFHFRLGSASISGHLRTGPPHPGGPVLPGPAP